MVRPATAIPGPARLLIGVLVALLLLLPTAMGAVAAEPSPSFEPTPAATLSPHLRLTAEPLLGSKVRPGQWAAVRVHLENDGPAVDGELRLVSTAAGDQSTFAIPVQAATGARQEHLLYARTEWFGGRYRVQLREGGSVLASADAGMEAIDGSFVSVGIVAEQPERLVDEVRRAFTERGGRTVVITSAGVEDLPPLVQAWAGLDLLVWQDAPTAALGSDQLDALRTWVAQGGDLLILAGSTGMAALEGLPADLLPFTPAGTIDVPATDLAPLVGSTPTGLAQVPALAGADGAAGPGRVMASAGDQVFAARLPVGRGSVTLLGVDPTTPGLVDTGAASALWARALPSDVREVSLGQGQRDRSLASALTTLPSVSTPRLDHLLLLFVAYALLLGPVSYFALRRLDRLEWAWLVMPALIAIFSIGAFVLGVVLKGSSVVAKELAVVRAAAGAETGLAEVQVSVFSPSGATFDIAVPGGTLLSAPTAVRRGGDVGPLSITLGEPSRVDDLRVDTGAQRSFRAEAQLPAPRIETDLVVTGGRLEGTVTNASDEPLEEVAVLYRSGLQAVGDLAPGERKPVSMWTGGETLKRRLLLQQLWRDPPAGDSASRLTRSSRQALLRHATAGVGWRGLSTGNGLTGGPLVLAWRTGAILDLDLGIDADRVGETLYLLPASTAVVGPVSLTGPALDRTIVETAAATARPRDQAYFMDRGWMTVSVGPPGVEGTFQATDLVLRVGRQRYPVSIRPVDLHPLPDAEQPSQDDPVATGPQPSAEPGKVGPVELPRLQLFDRTAGRWVEFERMDPATSYRVPDPDRYVDGSGTFLARFVVRADGPAVIFAIEARLDGTIG